MRTPATDDEIMDLCLQDMQNNGNNFSWHRYLTDSSQGMGTKYRAFVDAISSGPIAPGKGQMDIGKSELTEADQEELEQVQDALKTFRRKTVSFVALPKIGGASGADYTKAQMDKVWEIMRLGHKYPRKKRTRSRFCSVCRCFSSEPGHARKDDRAE